mgnify:CR=1 FL=1
MIYFFRSAISDVRKLLLNSNLSLKNLRGLPILDNEINTLFTHEKEKRDFAVIFQMRSLWMCKLVN